MIIVTGGAGFIGSALVWGLNKRGETEIVVVDEKGKEKHANLKKLKYEEFVDKESFLKNLGDYSAATAFLHMGACASTTEKNLDFLRKNNTEYTRKLCEFCLDNGIRFVYASSAATYGAGEKGYSDDHARLKSLRPLNPYGWSKHFFDLWALQSGALDKVAGLKYFNVYGPNEYHKKDMKSMVCKAFEQVKKTGNIGLFKSYKKEYADGEQKRDFLYVKDAVDMTLFFLDNQDKNGIYNVGAGKARAWNDLANAVFKAMKKPVKIQYIDMPAAIRNQYQYFTEADLKKLRAAGYGKPTTSLEAGVADYVKNYLLAKNAYLGG